jgi:pantoate--beta-alanine ligase
MKIFHRAQDLKQWQSIEKISTHDIGFVPTMGALHDGHRSLLQRCRSENKIAVCSIFVNPTQFNDPADYQNYPITTEADINMLMSENIDAVYMPYINDIYTDDHAPTFNFGSLESVLEGSSRPGHFRGVGMIVNLLLDVVHPARLYLGQKDFQQCAIIHNLLQQTDRQFIDLIICPTIRETDGLAMSSRNMRLSAEARKLAIRLYQAMSIFKNELLANAGLETARSKAVQILDHPLIQHEYLALAHQHTLQPMEQFTNESVILIASKVDGIRLIDNLLP